MLLFYSHAYAFSGPLELESSVHCQKEQFKPVMTSGKIAEGIVSAFVGVSKNLTFRFLLL
jgi:hypothetical protein